MSNVVTPKLFRLLARQKRARAANAVPPDSDSVQVQITAQQNPNAGPTDLRPTKQKSSPGCKSSEKP